MDSRYIHLHDALGLGAMWLKQDARLVQSSRVTAQKSLVSTHKTTTPLPPEGMSARLATLQKLGCYGEPETPKAAPETKKEENIVFSKEHYLTELANTIPKAKVMALLMSASPEDKVRRQILSGERGVLFHKMMAAIDLQPADVYLSTYLENKINVWHAPSAEQLNAATPRVAAEYTLSQAKAMLMVGLSLTRGDVRRRLESCVPNPAHIFWIPHPQQILDNPKLKRSTWETLQQLQQFLNQ